MKRLQDNPFQLYIYHIYGGIRTFKYDLKGMEYRTGDSELLRVDTSQSYELGKTHEIRLSPFLREVSEEEYLENLNNINLDDCLKTQSWGNNLSDSSILLSKLDVDETIDVMKYTKGMFEGVLNMRYAKGERITMDDIDELELVTHIMYDKPNIYGRMSLIIDKITFKDPSIRNPNIERAVDDGVYYDNSDIDDIYEIPAELTNYYFGEPSSFDLLSKRYLIDPVIFFNAELYKEFEKRNFKNIVRIKKAEGAW
jgi:hypothetical protein